MAAAIQNTFPAPSPALEFHRLNGVEAVLVRCGGAPGEATPVDACRQLHTRRPDLVVFVIAPGASAEDTIALLDAGADEVLPAPIDHRELDARLRALVRRGVLSQTPPNLMVGEIEIDVARGRAYKCGRLLMLPAKEFLLLRYLAQNPDIALSRAALLLEVWGYRSPFTRTVDVHVAMLRQHIEDNPHRPRYIQTVRGLGYRLVTPSVAEAL